MTEREAAQRLLARLPDTEVEVAGGFFAWRACLADIDEWGDLRALNGDTGVLRHLDEAEIEEFGETLWDSWQRLEREGKIEPRPPALSEPLHDTDERAREQREYAAWWIDHLPEADMPIVVAFLAWRARQSLDMSSGPAARLAAAGAEAMRLLDKVERRWLHRRHEAGTD